MTKPTLILALVLFLTSFLTACSASDQEVLEGRLLIWHSWEGAEREALEQILDNFRELHPELTITADFLPFDELEEAYLSQVEAGLGPDLLIAPADWAVRLDKARAIQDIAPYKVDQELYLSAAMDTLRNQDQVYGLPLSLSTSILYYNKNLLQVAGNPEESPGGVTELIQAKQEGITDTQTTELLDELLAEVEQNGPQSEALSPPGDVEQILEQASMGQIVTMRSDFYGGFWGVQAFGGQLFDEEGRVVLNQGGLANWLGWLKKAQGNPNIILNRNQDELLRLFTSAQASYYVGSTNELVSLQEVLGKEVLGVIRLPGRRNKQAGPFVQVEAMMFNRVSTRHNTQLALQLAQYLSNSENQRRLVLSVGKLPTNNQVNIDARIEPIVAEFIAQSKSAVSVRLAELDKFNQLVARGDELFGQVLAEEIGVGDAATLLTTEINGQYGLETEVANQLKDCDVAGELVLWNTWTDASRDALMELQQGFTDACAEASITIIDVESVELYDRYLEAFETDEAPDIFTGNNELIRRLAPQERLLNLNELLDPDFLQQFIPLVEQAVLFDGGVYAIPVSLNTEILYVNKELVPDPPVLLDDLLSVASPETEVAIPIGFLESYWGISAFGESSSAKLLDEEGRLIVGDSGLSDWLAWLAEAQRQPGMILSDDEAQLQSLFLNKDEDEDQTAALLVSDATQLSTIQGSFGEEALQLLPLPSGSPLLEVDGLLFNPLIAPAERAVALKFAQFMSNIESQSFLMQQANRVPTNINVSTANYPAISAFVEQADRATVIPNMPQVEAVLEWGDSVYEEVLQNNFDPALAVRDLTNLVDISNGFEVLLAEEEECLEEGEVTLWHSWDEIEEAAWQELITNFAERCATIKINPTFVEAADFNEALAATLEATDDDFVLPDIFFASHADLEAYQTQELIQDIGQAVDDTRRSAYLPKAIEGLSAGESLYGLPQAFKLPALYYHPDFVESPASTFASLLEQAEAGNKVAMNAGFYELFWGAAAFGCEPCQARQLFDEQGEFALNQADLAAWLRWLESAKNTNNIIFSPDQASLERLFLDNEVAYLVADVSFLNEAETELGIAHVSIAPLPFGEEEHAPTPFLTVESFFFHRQASEEQVQMALRFIEFASSQASQTLLMEQANVVPTTDFAIITADDPDITPFIEEIDASLLLPQQSRRELIEKSGLFDTYDELAK